MHSITQITSKSLQDHLCRRYFVNCAKISQRQRQETIMNVFDRKAKVFQRERALLLPENNVYDYLKEEVGFRVADRIFDIKRTFPLAVELGCGKGFVTKHLIDDSIKKIIQCDSSEVVLKQSSISETVPTEKMVVDEEKLPFEENSVDIIFSSLNLHWVNDLPGTFIQMRKCLKNDGVFIGSMFGGETLYELRCSLQLAELEREGGFAPHISPFTDVRDLGNLLNRAGFTMLTMDLDEFKISYPTMMELMFDLKGMGENNCSWNRKLHLHKDSILAAMAIYKYMYGNKDGSIPATFQILYMIGWKPDPTQPKPARRGSGDVSLKDLYKIDRIQKEKKDDKDNVKEEK